MSPRWPFPTGEMRSTIRPGDLVRLVGSSSGSFESGNSGVRSSNFGRLARVVGREAVDVVDAEERRVLLVARLRARRAADEVALAQREPPHLRRRHVDVLRTGEVPAGAEEAVALVAEVEEAR